MNKTTLIIAAVVIVVAVVGVVAGAYLLRQHTPFNPTMFIIYEVDGGPDEGTYTVIFAVQDKNNQSAPADGTVLFNIVDNRNTTIYEAIKTAKADDYTNINGTWVYSWSFPSSEVKPGVPTHYDWVHGKISFLSIEGAFFTADPIVHIPEMDKINITSLSWGANAPFLPLQYDPATWPTQQIYAGDTFSFSINVGVPFSFIPDINNIYATTPGFTVLSTDPILPIPADHESPQGNRISVTIRTPNQAYSGELAIYINATIPEGYSVG